MTPPAPVPPAVGPAVGIPSAGQGSVVREQGPRIAPSLLPASDIAARYVDSLPGPGGGGPLGRQVANDLLLVALLLGLLGLPISLVNATVRDNADRLLTLGRRVVRVPRVHPLFAGVDRVPAVVAAVAGSLVAGVLAGFVRPGVGIDGHWVAMVVGVAVGLLIVNGAQWAMVAAVTRRVAGQDIRLRLFPAFALIAAISVLLSRLGHLQPGLILGPLITLRYTKQPDRARHGQAWALAFAVLAVTSLGTWAARGPILHLLGRSDGFGIELVAVMLTTTTVSGIAALTFDLLPISFLHGAHVFRWSRKVWAALAVLAALAFVHIVTATGDGGQDLTRRTGHLAVLLLVYLGIAVSFWAAFRFRSSAPGDRPPVDEEPGASVDEPMLSSARN